MKESMNSSAAYLSSSARPRSGAYEETVSEQLKKNRTVRDKYYVPHSQPDYEDRRNEMTRELLRKEVERRGTKLSDDLPADDPMRDIHRAPPMRRYYTDGRRPGAYQGQPFRPKPSTSTGGRVDPGFIGYMKGKLQSIPSKYWIVAVILLIMNARRLAHIFGELFVLSDAAVGGSTPSTKAAEL